MGVSPDSSADDGGRPARRELRVVDVGPFRVLDASQDEFVEHVVSAAGVADRPLHVYALHVGGLNARHDERFVAAMRLGDVVGADGGSIIMLARVAGAVAIERVPTTDIGWTILRGLATRWGRPPRVALVGGPPGLARRAGDILAADLRVDVVHTEHGYHEDWTTPLAALREARPDVTLVGMGAPREMVWCHDNRESLTGSLLLTCGGWFGHLVGDERRAPRVLRRAGLEWIARVAQSPRRLLPRYARGFCSTAVMLVVVLRQRSKQPL